MEKRFSVKEAKKSLYFTDILDEYPDALLQEVYAEPENKHITYYVFTGSDKYILKTFTCSLENTEEYNAFKAKFKLHTKMAKKTKNVLKPIAIKECKRKNTNEVHVEALYEYADKDLTELIGKVKASVVLEIVKKSLESLAMLTKGTNFHFNVKPENLLFENEALKVIDFGISKSRHSKTLIIQNSNMKYTYAYCPPEIHQERVQLGKVDVYCWGMTIYQLITGKSEKKLNNEVRRYKLPGKDYNKFLDIVRSIKLINDNNISKQIIPMLLDVLSEDPEKRPEFKDLNAQLKKVSGTYLVLVESNTSLKSIRQQLANEIKSENPDLGKNRR